MGKKKVIIVVYICHVSLLENHDLRCCVEKRCILQTSTFREMSRELGFVTQTLELILSQLSCFFSCVVMLTSRELRYRWFEIQSQHFFD